MADRPIIFSAAMVRALLAGTKTQTRRLIRDAVPDAPSSDNLRHKPRHPAPYLDADCCERKTGINPRGMSTNWCWWTRDDRAGPLFRVGYRPGDRLWVREGFAGGRPGAGNLIFRAQHEEDRARGPRVDLPWRSPIHMPRWASRLTLTMTAVKVERLQDISREDAIAEGLLRLKASGRYVVAQGDQYFGLANHDPRAVYRTLWNSLHGPDAWAANPWVAALTFTVEQRNIDQRAAA